MRKHFSTKHKVHVKQTKLFIDGKWTSSVKGHTFETINPVNEEVITSVERAGIEDVDRAVAAARKAFDEGPWRKFSGQDRAR
jgi:aldehyde dehydrogenase (NAD+)